MPVTAGDAEAVIVAAEDITREAAGQDEARTRRKARQAGKKRAAGGENGNGRLFSSGNGRRDRQAEQERLRAEADAARTALLKRAVALHGGKWPGALRDCFGGVPEPRDPRGLRHPLPWWGWRWS